MQRSVCLMLWMVCILAVACLAHAESDQAKALRAKTAAVPYSPPESFTTAYFIADEVEPKYIFGDVKKFASSRACPTAWLIESAEKVRVDGASGKAGPLEYTLILEEDCPGKVSHYLFVDRSLTDPGQWLEWRRQFHKTKADNQYGKAKSSLEKATKEGYRVAAELRFVEIDGQLAVTKTETILTGDLKFKPAYDLGQGAAAAK